MAIVQTGQLGFDGEGLLGNINILHTVRRRKWIGLGVAIAAFGCAVTIALMWPPTYQSTATILIEEPDVPAELVKSTVSTYADQRLQVIEQRVMTNQNLSDIIDRFGLFQEALATTPRSELINVLRNKINLAVLSADFVSNKSRNDQPLATIAFTVSFSSQNPRTAQQVASRLTDLYLAENVQTRTEKAAGTTEFLTQQSTKLYQDVDDAEKKLTEFKTKNSGTLPEQVDTNMRILEALQSQLMQNRSTLEQLNEKRSFLQGQLGSISPYMPMTAGGMPATPQAQLMALELQYIDLSSRYGPKHPQVIHLQKQIDSLKNQVGTTDEPTSTQARLSQLQAQLSDALQRYGEKHPTVQKLRQQLDELQTEVAKAPGASMLTAPKGPPDNPMYIQMQNQLGEATAQMQGIQMETAALQAKVEDTQQRVLQTQALSGQYSSLQQQYEAAVKRYQDFKDKEADAQVAQSMEQQSKSETFSVIEAPDFPERPIKPNRKLLLLAGAVVAAMFAAAAMLILELLDSKVYEPRGLQLVFGEVPLATVPYITTPRERTNKWIKVAAVFLVGIAAIAGGLVALHTLVTPLDVLWAAFINRINP
ncbi:GumC family protein [Dongia sedimenti]|uniref:Wzz/FepE/Etk N-terminal domain-containing protein n=1 Tax=Dongia sedimenti TaxID=3064282 RepID=A0ABU0YR67_9PROT|nr:Wzz/FepE/Etk N-terminal domain-containing protein [Rhodospirillaceae bacterium R-7]